jgi:predicted DNA-binding antitoxin AbrB/MazE fold protein
MPVSMVNSLVTGFFVTQAFFFTQMVRTNCVLNTEPVGVLFQAGPRRICSPKSESKHNGAHAKGENHMDVVAKKKELLKVAIKIFVTSDKMATFPCSECGKSYKKDVSKYIGHETQVRLKYRCKCKNSFSVLLERRRSIRKTVDFSGYLLNKQQRIPLTVIDISKHGMKIKILEKLPLKEGQKIQIEFSLDDPKKSIVSKTVQINKIMPSLTLGCEFIEQGHYGDLGKFFLFHF